MLVVALLLAAPGQFALYQRGSSRLTTSLGLLVVLGPISGSALGGLMEPIETHLVDLLKVIGAILENFDLVEVEIRLQRIFEALSEIDLTLQAIVAYQD